MFVTIALERSNILGAVSLSTLGLLFPAILQTSARWNITTGHAKSFMILKNALIGLVGFAGFVIGTTMSIKNIISPENDESGIKSSIC